MSKDNETDQRLNNNLKCDDVQRAASTQAEDKSVKDKEPEEELFFWAEPGVCG